MTTVAHPCIERLADVWAALGAIGHGLDDADWLRATDCPGWTVKDQYAHVIGTESLLDGRPTPEAVPPGPHVTNPIGEWNELWVDARRAVPGPDVLAELEEVTAARLASLRAMTAEELATPGPSPIGTVAYETFMDVRVMDCWIHEHDVRAAVGLPWRFDGPAAPAAMDRLAATFGYTVGKGVGPPDGTVVVLDVTGPAPRRLAVEMRGGRAVPVAGDAPDDAPGVRLSTDTATWVRLAAGRTTPAEVAGSVDVTGDATLGEAVLAHLRQMP